MGARRVGAADDAGALWRSWVVRVTAGEFLGFLAPATVGALTAGAPAPVALPALLVAGAVEGAVLGRAQAVVLRRGLPRLVVGRFVAATAAAAVIAYLIALVPVAVSDRLARLPVAVLVPGAAVLGAALLATIGTAQWLVLRRVVDGSASWIATTAAAWALGLPAFAAVTTPLWRPGQPVALVVAIGALGGLVMAVVVAAVTGAAAVRLLRRAARRAPDAAGPSGAG